MKNTRGFPLFLIFMVLLVCARAQNFTRQDTLRGSVTPQRAWWDLLHYDLRLSINIKEQSLSGSNTITYEAVSEPKEMQIDLQPPLKITKVSRGGKEMEVRKEGNAHFIKLDQTPEIGAQEQITIFWEGKPKVAVRPPWDGGVTWSEDANGNPFIATSNQGIGASIWWPCKDHPKDEPDLGVTMSFTVPDSLVAVGNGRLIDRQKNNGTATYIWEVKNPINAYGVNLNVGDYARFEETYDGEKGELDMFYYVLSYNLEKAKEHFKDARRTMEAFEYWFGAYPFYEDSYKLVEVPYLGMEHQSSVTYGNNYQMGYKGRDLSLSGWGLKWDYLIIHETGHEWFANNITYQDRADMWIHESFTTYAEGLFVEYHYGPKAGAAYIRGMRHGISNDEPIIAAYGVNARGGDLYNKGSNILHTLRQWVADDEKWRSILRGLNEEFYHQTVTSQDIEKYIAEKSGLDLTAFFDQYLRDTQIPVLEYFTYENMLLFRWTNCQADFDMPVRISVGDESHIIHPRSEWNLGNPKIEVADISELSVDPNYYIYPVFLTGSKE